MLSGDVIAGDCGGHSAVEGESPKNVPEGPEQGGWKPDTQCLWSPQRPLSLDRSWFGGRQCGRALGREGRGVEEQRGPGTGGVDAPSHAPLPVPCEEFPRPSSKHPQLRSWSEPDGRWGQLSSFSAAAVHPLLLQSFPASRTSPTCPPSGCTHTSRSPRAGTWA